MRPICESCGIEIRWEPTMVGQTVYCCTGCAQGGPCSCDYGLLLKQQRHTAIIVHRQRAERITQADGRQDRA